MRRIITKETRALSRVKNPEAAPSQNPLGDKYRGIVVESAEGLRFAYAATPLPVALGEIALAQED